MDIQINQKPLTLPEGATVADALVAFGARHEIAIHGDGERRTRAQHGARALSAGDRLDVVSPVAGG